MGETLLSPRLMLHGELSMPARLGVGVPDVDPQSMLPDADSMQPAPAEAERFKVPLALDALGGQLLKYDSDSVLSSASCVGARARASGGLTNPSASSSGEGHGDRV